MKYLFTLTFLVIQLASTVFSGALHLTKANFDTVLGSHELVILNFYADWCRFSNMLAPIFDEAADKIQAQFPGRAVLGKVDCETDSSISQRFAITKYPTIKVIKNGQVSKKEYRGQRSPEAFLQFATEELRDPVKIVEDFKEFANLDSTKRYVLGYFEDKNSSHYENYRKVSSVLKDDCIFLAGYGETVRMMHPPGSDIISFRPAKARSTEDDETFMGNVESLDELTTWAKERCVPMVREITFENAEELTEEGLPFLILFHDPDDNESVKKYYEVIQNELLEDKQNVNFLTADGNTFAHPLQHLGKSKKDLPLIAIDSFRHMYLFPDYKDIFVKGKLKAFLQDLYSGKLHREFHYGPDPSSSEQPLIDGKVPETSSSRKPAKEKTTPPESTFKKLAPSKNRYTLLDKDEL
ncbi:endoplasmic reticulum resident protein 44-like isoform X1 [Artemia franciscana]|uniref:Thioredoxin domain-containing protein n=2 Tax=Artemia franciscana TaxID=6661 RepID=A0AA88I9Z8_ARTSF|nr:hypothetical protein QYM36_001770 [Artemia franciscana]